jgi:hypothetical protein
LPFGLLILEEAELAHGQEFSTIVILTVLFSVFLYGLSAVLGAKAYTLALSANISRHERTPGRQRAPTTPRPGSLGSAPYRIQTMTAPCATRPAI